MKDMLWFMLYLKQGEVSSAPKHLRDDVMVAGKVSAMLYIRYLVISHRSESAKHL